jgi:hypothetical protein
MLKALYVHKQQRHAPPLHNLLRLAHSAGIDVDDAKAEQLTTVTAFNLEARYPDFKRSFRQICTPEYTSQQMAVIQELLQWLKSHLRSSTA